jgi:hypothetical protein
MTAPTKSTTLLDQAQSYKDELIVPIRHELTRPDGSIIRTTFTWFAVDTEANIIEEREEDYISLDGVFEVAKRYVDLQEAVSILHIRRRKMTIQIPRNDTIAQHQDWVVIAVKTNRKFVTYSFIAISPEDELFHIDDGEFQSVADAISVGRKFVDLEEVKVSARGMN